MARERRFFSEEFKHEAVKLASQPGASRAAIAQDLGIGANLLRRWCRDAEAEQPVSKVGGEKVSVQEYERMRRELAKVKTERDILKKALGYFAVGPK
jgi:transposase